MISRAGHIALILPNLARGPLHTQSIGIYRYLGNKAWDVIPSTARRSFLHIGVKPMSGFTAADTLHRLVKQALDSGEAATVAEAQALFAGYGVSVAAPADVPLLAPVPGPIMALAPMRSGALAVNEAFLFVSGPDRDCRAQARWAVPVGPVAYLRLAQHAAPASPS